MLNLLTFTGGEWNDLEQWFKDWKKKKKKSSVTSARSQHYDLALRQRRQSVVHRLLPVDDLAPS